MTIHLVLPVPPSGNHYKKLRRQGGFTLTDEARDFHAQVAAISRRAKLEPITEGQIDVEMWVFRGERVDAKGKRRLQRGDVDNFQKVLLDSLQGNAFRNDSQIRDLHAHLREDRENPRVEVLISPLEQTAPATPRVAQPEFNFPGTKVKIKAALSSATYRPGDNR